jgi:hypothetical protein
MPAGSGRLSICCRARSRQQPDQRRRASYPPFGFTTASWALRRVFAASADLHPARARAWRPASRRPPRPEFIVGELDQRSPANTLPAGLHQHLWTTPMAAATLISPEQVRRAWAQPLPAFSAHRRPCRRGSDRAAIRDESAKTQPRLRRRHGYGPPAFGIHCGWRPGFLINDQSVLDMNDPIREWQSRGSCVTISTAPPFPAISAYLMTARPFAPSSAAVGSSADDG